jgi:predicted PurR-regulated permease PerM
MDRQLNFSITTGTIVKILFILALAWALVRVNWLILDVLVAIVIASAVEPGVRKLVHWRFPRVLAVISIYLIMFAVFFIVIYFFMPLLLEDLGQFVQQIPDYLQSMTHMGAVNQYAQILGVPAPSQISVNDVMAGIRNSLDVSEAITNPIGAATQIFGGVFSFIIIIVFSFYFAVLETGVEDFLRIIVPKRRQHYVLGLWKRSQHKIGLWMQGQLILAFIMGVFVYLCLAVFQVPHPLILAAVAAVFEIIPVFGPTLAAAPGVLIAFLSGGPIFGLFIAGIYIILQQFENHLIYPQVVTRVVGVPPLLVILALIAGGELAGFLGIILAVPLAGTIQELAKDIESGHLFADENENAHA